ncbi:MAG: hypothetical protein AAGF68_04450 [Pseudomonadota bacterium]
MRLLKMRGLLAALALTLTSCGTVNFDNLPSGRFEGVLHVVWVGEGDPGAGDGAFIYIPDPVRPLSFIRTNPDATITRITPPALKTDGGSIPRPAQLFNGFSPWGYGPAYIVHDWLFVARHCLSDENPDPVYQPYAAVSFQESADIIAEAIKALIDQERVAPNDIAPRVISGTVAGPISRSIWNETGRCADHQVDEDTLASANLGLPRPPGLRTLRGLNLPTDVPAGTTVATFSF